MVPVYGNTLSQNHFLAAVDKMINTLFTFTASRIGWILDKIIQLGIKFATFNPIRVSSCLSNLPELEAPHLLLNIRNQQDQNGFLHCFTAAWLLKHGPLLYAASRIPIGDERTSPKTYSPRNQLPIKQWMTMKCPWALDKFYNLRN